MTGTGLLTTQQGRRCRQSETAATGLHASVEVQQEHRTRKRRGEERGSRGTVSSKGMRVLKGGKGAGRQCSAVQRVKGWRSSPTAQQCVVHGAPIEPHIATWCIHVHWSSTTDSCRCTVMMTIVNISSPFCCRDQVWPLSRSAVVASAPDITIDSVNAACNSAVPSQPTIAVRLK